jgi:hypothetical protein
MFNYVTCQNSGGKLKQKIEGAEWVSRIGGV